MNHSAVKELSKDFGRNLTELNCNIHPLHSLAKGANNILIKMEKDKGSKANVFGKEAVALTIKNAVSKLKI